MTTEAPVKVCMCGETRRCVLCTPGMFPAVIAKREPVPLWEVTEEEIDNAIRHAPWTRRQTIEVNLRNPGRREAARYALALGKRCGTYQPND